MGNCSGHWNNWSKDDNGKFERSDRRFFCSNCHFEKKHNGSCECSVSKDKKEEKEEKCQIHKQKKCKCRDGGNNGRTVVDFQYDVANPNVFLAGGLANISLAALAETPVAAITFNNVQEDSVIELKGLLTVLAAVATTGTVRIRRIDNNTGLPTAGTVIYQTPPLTIPLVSAEIPVLHVDDNFTRCFDSVTYVLTITPLLVAVLSPPRTFTGTEYN